MLQMLIKEEINAYIFFINQLDMSTRNSMGKLKCSCYVKYLLTNSAVTEHQIRGVGGWGGGGGTEDNSWIIFLILKENICCDPSLELFQ